MRTYSRRDIIEFIYSEYPSSDPEIKEIIHRCSIQFIKMKEEDFVEYVNKNAPFVLERLRKNTYYIR